MKDSVEMNSASSQSQSPCSELEDNVGGANQGEGRASSINGYEGEGPGIERNPDYVEDRFRVDRRKLEQLIQESPENDNAENFFTKIMRETNVHIAWPSKLKIGAKSKKDPHIKLSGNRSCVAEARTRIMTVLDTKSLRVTLKMDVSHTDHSHVIGKGGNNIKRVMQETHCHIHFPDSNRNNNMEKSSQVSIAGDSFSVEQARIRIRDLLPLIFMFEVPNSATIPTTDISMVAQHVQSRYGVTVSIKQTTYTRSVVIRGSVCNAKLVKEAVTVVNEMLTGQAGVPVQISLLVDIAHQHHPLLFSPTSSTLAEITHRTGVRIYVPPSPAVPGTTSLNPNPNPTVRRGTAYLTGGLPNVCSARQQLLGCLPLVLMFDAKEDVDLKQVYLNSLMEQLNVFIGVKPKNRQLAKSVIVKSVERNATNLYEARRRILGLTEHWEQASIAISRIDDRFSFNEKDENRMAQQISGRNTQDSGSTAAHRISGSGNTGIYSNSGTINQSGLSLTNSSIPTCTLRGPDLTITPLPAAHSPFIPTILPPPLVAQHCGVLAPQALFTNLLPPVRPEAMYGNHAMHRDSNSGAQTPADIAAWQAFHNNHVFHQQQQFLQQSSLPQQLMNHQQLLHDKQLKSTPDSQLSISQSAASTNQILANAISTNQNIANPMTTNPVLTAASSAINQSSPVKSFATPNQNSNTVLLNKNAIDLNETDHMSVENIATNNIASPFTNHVIPYNSTGDHFSVSTATASHVIAGINLSTNDIAAGNLSTNSIAAGNLSANHITADNLSADHVAGLNRSASHTEQQLYYARQQYLEQQQQEQQLQMAAMFQGRQQLPMFWNPMNTANDGANLGLPNDQGLFLEALMNTLSLSSATTTSVSGWSTSALQSLAPSSLIPSPTHQATPPFTGPIPLSTEYMHRSAASTNNTGLDAMGGIDYKFFNGISNLESSVCNGGPANRIAANNLSTAGFWGGNLGDSAGLLNDALSGFVQQGQHCARNSLSGHGSIEKHSLIDDVCNGNMFSSSSVRDERNSPRSDGSNGEEIDGPDHLQSVQSLIMDNFENLLSDASYNEMKQKADKAMQVKPVGECRVPTDYWSGFGFSKSMPGSAIREKIALNKLNGYIGPSMSTTFENCDAEQEADVWKNPDSILDLGGPAYHASIDALDTVAVDNTLRDLVAKISASSSQIDLIHRVPSEESIASIWSPRSVEDLRGEGRGRVGGQGALSSVRRVDIPELLHQLGLSKYIDIFVQQEIDLATFLTLTDQDLRELGVTTFGARRKILLAISDINERQMSVPPPPGLPNPFQLCSAANSRHNDIASQSGRW